MNSAIRHRITSSLNSMRSSSVRGVSSSAIFKQPSSTFPGFERGGIPDEPFDPAAVFRAARRAGSSKDRARLAHSPHHEGVKRSDYRLQIIIVRQPARNR
ncbi:hypothetical protein [Sorangium sp. So ce176]|uniref:hypothetical protein n=1 Tax=Sorangium sp. So ce176 TaxID=3133286 RepID=UPI003F5E6ADF